MQSTIETSLIQRSNDRLPIRILDIVFSLIGILTTFPIIAIVAILIRVQSKGPAFYKQERLGIEKQPFILIKFRTMRLDAEKNGETWAVENDSRITTIGVFLRKYRLDELPQFWNILKGEMSFVGPRPIRKKFALLLENEDPTYHKRFKAKPGLTGWAQLYAPYGATIDEQLEKLPYDLKYNKGLTVLEYMKVILLTTTKLSSSSGI